MITLAIWVYPGSFDPITNGHLDIIHRAAKSCDKLIVATLINVNKNPAFALEERVQLMERATEDIPNVEVDSFSGLLIEFMKEKKATTIIKGLRAMSDFEYEFQMALLNKMLDPDVETLFMMTNVNYSYLSSSSVKEIARYGGSIQGLVPECIRKDIVKKFQ